MKNDVKYVFIGNRKRKNLDNVYAPCVNNMIIEAIKEHKREAFEQSSNMPPWIIPIKRIVYLVQDSIFWCARPYPNHPKGCPNYNKKTRCPPFVRRLDETMNGKYIVHSEFSLKAHAEKMKVRHPAWTDRQCRNLLYWQGTSRKQLKERVKAAMRLTNSNKAAFIPEAQGVNVFATCAIAGLRLDKTKRIHICRHVAIIGRRI